MGLVSRLASIVIIAVVPSGVVAQIALNGAGFDPTPVSIPATVEGPQRPITNMDLLTIRDLHGVQISPDGKYVAFVVGQAVLETNSYRSGLFIISTSPDSKPISLGTAGSPHWDEINQWVDDPPKWSRDSQHLYYRLNRTGIWQVWRWTLTGDGPLQVTHAPHDVKDFQLTPDGKQLVLNIDQPAFTPSELQEVSEHGVLYDGSIRPWLSRPFLDEVVEANHKTTDSWIHDLGSGDERKATESELKRLGPWESDLPEKQFVSLNPLEGHHIISSRTSPDGRSVAFLQFFDDLAHGPRDSQELFSKPVRGGRPIALTPGAHLVFDPYWWSLDSKLIYYTESRGDGHSRRFMVVPVTGGTPRQVVRAPDGDWLDGFSADSAVRWVACTREDNNTPPQVALANVSNGEIRVLVDLNPQFHDLKFGKSSRIDFSNQYGDAFHGHVVLPLTYEQGKRYPLIIVGYVDGDFFLRGGVGDEYPIQVFAAEGFVILQFDYGHDRNFNPGDFDTAILQWESPVEGMNAAVQKLAALNVIDPKRVGVTGFSHGAELASYAISHTHFAQAAIQSQLAGRNPYSFYATNNVVQQWYKNWGLDALPEGKSSPRWHKLSTTLNADHIQAPLLVNVADTEYLSGLDQIAVMKTLGKPIEVFIYPNELHDKSQPKHRHEIYERNVDWLKFWLLDKEDPDPGKRQQYERWRVLRNNMSANHIEKPASVNAE